MQLGFGKWLSISKYKRLKLCIIAQCTSRNVANLRTAFDRLIFSAAKLQTLGQ
jgi:hypothetical protein